MRLDSYTKRNLDHVKSDTQAFGEIDKMQLDSDLKEICESMEGGANGFRRKN